MEKIKKVYKEEIAKSKLLSLEWENPNVYKQWLAQTFYYASYSTRIIGLAGCLFDYSKNDLHLKFLEHVKEEKNHEKILLVDLKNLNSSLEQYEPCSSSQVLFQNQYYWIQNVDPIAVYGYFLYLEGLAVEFGPAIYQRLKKSYPENAIRYLKVHVEEDQGHIEGHYQFMHSLSETQKNYICENLVQTSYLYEEMVRYIKSINLKFLENAA